MKRRSIRRALLLGAFAAAGAGATACSCEDEDSRPRGAVDAGPDAQNDGGVRARRRVPGGIYLERALGRCDVLHNGITLDLGEPDSDVARNFAVGPFPDVENVEREGASFARIKTKRISYDFWLDRDVDQLEVTLRARGGAARRISTYIDNAYLGTARLDRDETKLVTMGRRYKPDADVEGLSQGRHRLLVKLSGRSKREAYADIDWIRIGLPETLTTAHAAPTRRSLVHNVVIAGTPRQSIALTAPGAVRCPLNIVAGTRLDTHIGLWGAGSATAEIRVLVDGKAPETLERRKVTGGDDGTWLPMQVDLSKYTDQLIAIELRAEQTSKGARLVFGDTALVPSTPRQPRVPKARGVVVVLLSSVERQRLPPWGPIGSLTALSALGRDAAAFDHYRAPSTLPAAVLSTLLTGLSPRAHGLEDPSSRLPEGVQTITQVIKAAGFHTAMFTGVPTSFRPFGFDAGWDRFEEYSPVSDLGTVQPYRDAAEWLEGHLENEADARFFAVIYARGAHPPWDLSVEEVGDLEPEEYGGVLRARRAAIILKKIRKRRRRSQRRLKEEDWVRLHAFHDAALAKQGAGLERLMSALKEAGVWDDTLFVLAGDVAIGAQPQVPFDPTPPLTGGHLAPPLLVKFPENKFAGTRVDTPVTTSDLAVTILRALELAPPKPRPVGEDLYASAADVEPIGGRALLATLGENYSVRLGLLQLHGELRKPPHLCELDLDPSCVSDVVDDRPIASRGLWRATFFTERAAMRVRDSPPVPAIVDAETEAALVVWGY